MDDFSHLLQRIQAFDPALDTSQAIVNADGLVNVAIIVGQRVFRFLRRPEDAADLHLEVAMLDVIRRAVRLPVPHFQLLAEDVVSYDFLAGDALTRTMLLRASALQREQLVRELSEFIVQLHAIPSETLLAIGVPQADPARHRARWLQLYEDIQAELFPLMYRSTRDHVREQFAPLLEDADFLTFTPCFIHNDLAQYHILIDATRQHLAGILDFGVAYLGDPAQEYGILLNVYGETLLAWMAEHDPRLPALIDRARFYQATAELQWVLAGVRSQQMDWFTAHLDRARDVRPYGMPLRS